MSDAVEETQETSDKDPDEPKGLRKQVVSLNAELKAYKDRERETVWKDAGFDTTQGIGKAIFQVYDGDVSIEAITKFAFEEYGHDVSVEPETVHPQAQQIAEAQQRVDDLTSTAGSVADVTQVDALAKAEAEGDYVTTMQIKGQQIADMMRPPRR